MDPCIILNALVCRDQQAAVSLYIVLVDEPIIQRQGHIARREETPVTAERSAGNGQRLTGPQRALRIGEVLRGKPRLFIAVYDALRVVQRTGRDAQLPARADLPAVIIRFLGHR